MEAIVLQDYYATNVTDLSFQKDQVVAILNPESPTYWYQATIDDRYGYIPTNLVKLAPHKWYCGCKTFEQAAALLMDKHEGAFLVYKMNYPADFALVAQGVQQAYQFEIHRTPNGWFFLDNLPQTSFPTINQLIDHYKTVSLIPPPQFWVLKNTIEEYHVVQAIKDFHPTRAGQLKFNTGDIIIATGACNNAWWHGQFGNVRGIFPANCVVPFKPRRD